MPPQDTPEGTMTHVPFPTNLEIVFYDVETTIPTRRGEKPEILEYGAVVLSSQGFFEKRSFSAFVRPSSLNKITRASTEVNGISPTHVQNAKSFEELADEIYSLMHGKVWAGHNIKSFDDARINEAFAKINRSPPVPVGEIDTLHLLRRRFGTRAGDMKLRSLGKYCGLGEQAHRSLDDVRLNIDVFKQCSSMLLLESEHPDIFPPPPLVTRSPSPRSPSRSRSRSPSPPTVFPSTRHTTLLQYGRNSSISTCLSHSPPLSTRVPSSPAVESPSAFHTPRAMTPPEGQGSYGDTISSCLSETLAALKLDTGSPQSPLFSTPGAGPSGCVSSSWVNEEEEDEEFLAEVLSVADRVEREHNMREAPPGAYVRETACYRSVTNDGDACEEPSLYGECDAVSKCSSASSYHSLPSSAASFAFCAQSTLAAEEPMSLGGEMALFESHRSFGVIASKHDASLLWRERREVMSESTGVGDGEVLVDCREFDPSLLTAVFCAVPGEKLARVELRYGGNKLCLRDRDTEVACSLKDEFSFDHITGKHNFVLLVCVSRQMQAAVEACDSRLKAYLRKLGALRDDDESFASDCSEFLPPCDFRSSFFVPRHAVAGSDRLVGPGIIRIRVDIEGLGSAARYRTKLWDSSRRDEVVRLPVDHNVFRQWAPERAGLEVECAVQTYYGGKVRGIKYVAKSITLRNLRI